jgi:hypothetical protein
MAMSFGGSFQTGPDSLYQGADLIRKNEEANLRMQELRRVEEARKQLAADELLNQSTPDVRASWSSGMTDVVNAPAQVRPAVQPPLNLPPAQQPVVGRVAEPPPGASSVRRMSPEEVARLKQQQAGTLPITEMSEVEFKSLTPAQRLRRLQDENDRRALTRLDANVAKPPAALFDVLTLPYTGAATLLEKGLNAADFARVGRAAGIYDSDVNSVTIPGAGSITPFYDRLRKAEDANQPLTEKQLLEQLKQKDVTRAKEAKVKGEKIAQEETRLSTEKANKRLTDLVNLAPQALQKDETKYLVGRSQELGIDPAAAVAIYGIESSYGAAKGSSTAGAKGSMQVMDKTFKGMKTWFTDPKNIEAYNISPELQQAAAAMVRGTPQGEMDAGLLVLKYNELIGVPKNLWGAGYQGNANQVLKKGAPLNATDGGLTNSDYNGVYVGLYNNISRALGINSTLMAAGPKPTPAATAVRPGGNMTEAQIAALQADPLALNKNPPAPVAAAPVSVGAVNLGVTPAQVAAAPKNQDGSINLGTTPAQMAAAPRNQDGSVSLNAQEQNRPASTTTVVAQRVAAEPVPKFVEPKEIYNAGAYAKPLEVGLLRREQTKRMADIMMRTGNVYKAMELRGVLDTMDNQLYKMQGDQGVAEFLQSGGRDANRMMGVYSYYTNQQYQLQPRRDGLFNLVANGQVVSQGMPAEKVVERIRLTLDEGFRQQQAAIAGKLFDSDIKIREQNAKTMGEYIKDIGIKTIEGKTQLDVEKLKMMKYDVKPTGAGDGTVVITPPFGAPFVFNPTGTTVEIDGNKILSFSARPITGMPSLSWANKG